jgi:integrase
MNHMSKPTNAFSDPTIPTLEQVRDQIALDYGIEHQKRMDMASAINAIGKLLDLPLSIMPASAEFLRQRLKAENHLTLGVSKRRLQNVRSLVLRALRQVGLSTKLASYQMSMNDAWQALYDRLPGRYERTAFSRFFRYCSKADIRPEDVNDAVLDDYLVALIEESLRKDPRTIHQTVCRLWNKMCDAVDGWPGSEVMVPGYDDRIYRIGNDLIHPDLHAAIACYLGFLAGDSLFDGLKRPFRPISIVAVTGHLRRYVSALHHDGFDISTLRRLDDLTRPEVFERAMEWLWRRNDNKTSKHIGEIAWVIRCIAVKHLECDEETELYYAAALQKLRVAHHGLSPKNQKMLSQFDDPEVVRRFVKLPDLLWQLAEKEGKTKKGSLYAQIAVAIEILIFAPMRLKNLRNLRLDRHIGRIGEHVSITVPAEEVKNRERLHFKLPRRLSERIRSYVDVWRCLFFDDANPHLFPGRNGKPKDETALRCQITRYAFEHGGVRITPHQFRHGAAKLLLDAKPGHYEVVRKILGHKNITTTYEHYAGAETQAAVELYDDVILGLKDDPGGDLGRDRKNDEDLPYLDPFNPFLNGRR